jgi:23S rRNA pseudouridine1911/1915/1917 synthase
MEDSSMAVIEILYEDNHLLAVNKPPGILTQPSGTASQSLEERSKAWIKETKKKPGDVYLHAVHRLDRPASGIVLFARTSKALSRMNEQMRKREIVKIYHAILTNMLPADEGTLENILRHSRLRAVTASSEDPGARLSSLTYRVLKCSGGLVLVEAKLGTGRYHQIRAQFAACGCPILGDTRYGGETWADPEGIALHHRRMEFLHPISKSPIRIEAPYPETWPRI